MSVVAYADLVRDLRHLDARASADLIDWLAFLEVEGKSGQTLYTYTRQIAPLLRAYPELAVDEIGAAEITAVLATKPVRSRAYTRKVIARWFAWLEDEERVEPRVMKRVPKPKTYGARPRDIFTQAEVALLEALPSPDGPLLTLLFKTGMRKGECRMLRWEHIQLGRARLVVYGGKGNKDRVIPLPDDALFALDELQRLEGLNAEDHLWYSRRGNRRLRRDPIASSTYDRWWCGQLCQGGVLKAAGVRYLGPHQSRHTYGHRLRELGYDLEERKVLMGHESIETTEHYYGRVTVEDVARKVSEVGV